MFLALRWFTRIRRFGMVDIANMTPKERVFGTLKNLKKIIDESPDLNARRDQLSRSLDRAISWEPELVDRPDVVHAD